MDFSDDAIAKAVLTTYDALSPKYKPVKATDEFFQWVPLSGIVATKGNHPDKAMGTSRIDEANTLGSR